MISACAVWFSALDKSCFAPYSAALCCEPLKEFNFSWVGTCKYSLSTWYCTCFFCKTLLFSPANEIYECRMNPLTTVLVILTTVWYSTQIYYLQFLDIIHFLFPFLGNILELNHSPFLLMYAFISRVICFCLLFNLQLMCEIYLSHIPSREELETVEAFASGLSVDNWICCKFQMLNRPLAPVLVLLFKRYHGELHTLVALEFGVFWDKFLQSFFFLDKNSDSTRSY